jgi:adenosylcobalamin-dependent ribonucleoside-triphosphate reductase
MYTLMWNFKFLPPGRGLKMMGTDHVAKVGGAALNNCAFVSTRDLWRDPIGPFTFLMDMSMLGVGVGADTKGAGQVYVKRPKLYGKQPKPCDSCWEIPDSREGWCEALRRAMEPYFYNRSMVELKYDKIRPLGTPIKGFGGVSSGPEPLKKLITDVRKLLDRYIGEELDSTGIVDIFNMIGRCVISGNVRRSAEIMIGDPADTEFLELKDPKKNKEELEAYRWASNNSIFATQGMNYKDVAEQIATNGEPGIVWLDNARAYGRMIDGPNNLDINASGCNPCGEQTLESCELCCLVETFPANHKDLHDYTNTLKYAYLYGKTVTLVPTHDERVNAVMLRNRRIGLSQSGIAQNIAKIGVHEHMKWCDIGYNYVTSLDKVYSQWLCIPESIKKTSVKPSGTVSLLCGATPGIHNAHSKYYFRLCKYHKSSPFLKAAKKAGYATESDGKDHVYVYFPVKEGMGRFKGDISLWEQLELAAQMQNYWSDNQVSVTINFKQDQAGELGRALEMYQSRLKAVSCMVEEGHGYKFAPYQSITEEQYNAAVANISKLDLKKIKDNLVDQKEFCDGDKCKIS